MSLPVKVNSEKSARVTLSEELREESSLTHENPFGNFCLYSLPQLKTKSIDSQDSSAFLSVQWSCPYA